jgi:hypothetical protein
MSKLFEKVKADKPFKRGDIIAAIALVLAVAVFFAAAYPRQKGGYAEIYNGNNLIKVMPLSTDGEFVFNYDENHKNIITVKDGRISVTYADCRNKICVNHPPTDIAGSSIICLPHNLIIVVKGDSDVDGVVS